MSTNHLTDHPLLAGIYEIRSSWGWFMFLGILLILLGAICIIGNVAATFATVITLGWFLIISGVVALVHAFRVHAWGSGFSLHLLSALFRGFMGYLLIRYPGSGAVTLTLLLAFFLIVGGLFRAIAAGTLKFPRWGWSVISGVISFTLGILLLAEMPVSSLWFIGFVIGLDMIFEGASLIGFASALHHIPDEVAPYRAA
jgi:uncharacterized membrane protein HdeD (DUF308 family)